MAFEFDAGNQRSNPAAEGLADAWMDAVTDAAGGADAPRHKVLQAAAAQIINDIWNHKSTDGVRRMFWRRMTVLNEMSASEPASHDDVVENLHERLCALKEIPASAGIGTEPVKSDNQPANQTTEKEMYNGF